MQTNTVMANPSEDEILGGVNRFIEGTFTPEMCERFIAHKCKGTDPIDGWAGVILTSITQSEDPLRIDLASFSSDTCDQHSLVLAALELRRKTSSAC